MNTEEELQNMWRVISCGGTTLAHAKEALTFLRSCAFATEFEISFFMILTRCCGISPLLSGFLVNICKKMGSKPQSTFDEASN